MASSVTAPLERQFGQVRADADDLDQQRWAPILHLEAASVSWSTPASESACPPDRLRINRRIRLDSRGQNTSPAALIDAHLLLGDVVFSSGKLQRDVEPIAAGRGHLRQPRHWPKLPLQWRCHRRCITSGLARINVNT